MKILVVGASGHVGRSLMAQLKLRTKDHVVGSSSHAKPDYLQLDLHASQAEITQKITGFDVICFVAGSRGQDILQTDLNGAVKLMQAAETSHVTRFIQLSSAFALQPDRWSEGYLRQITDYNIAKFFADHWLTDNIQLNYTILQPGVLTDTPETGHVQLNSHQLSENSIQDVGHVLARLLDYPNTSRKIIIMGAGTTPINQALKDL